MRGETWDYMRGYIKGRYPNENLSWRVDRYAPRSYSLCIISLDDLTIDTRKATVVYESDSTKINSLSGLCIRDLEEMIKTLKPV